MQRFGEKLHLNNQDNRRKEPSSERELLEACKRGDRTAQKKLYDSLAAKMFAICLRYMGQRDVAEDVLQEGFITLFSRLDSYSGEGSFEGWARKIFVNTALMERQQRRGLPSSVRRLP